MPVSPAKEARRLPEVERRPGDDFEAKATAFDDHGVEMVPILYRGPFSWGLVESLTYGDTMVCPVDQAGKFTGREGCVVTPTTERYCPKMGGSGRVILKSISADYLARKGATDN